MRGYYRTTQYQNYLQAKQRWDAAELRDDDDMHFSMEPVDDVPTDDNIFSHRALCATRFHRNKFLMLDIMSENVVSNHMKIMRQEQLNSLSFHRQVKRIFILSAGRKCPVIYFLNYFNEAF